jgi:TrmH family RNA methyltransferase
MPKMEAISSPANPLLKDVRGAVVRGGLTERGYCVTETFHLLNEALRSECEVYAVLAAESVRAAIESYLSRLTGVRVFVLPDGIFQKLGDTKTSQGVVTLVRLPVWTIESLLRGNAPVVVLDGLQDPGNAGSIVRAAEAFGASGVCFLKGTVSPLHPKTLRASAGSLFRLPFVHGLDAALVCAAMKQHRIDLYASMPAYSQTMRISEADLTRPFALIIGSEARGVSLPLRAAALDLTIPTVRVESLNAAVAAGIMLYEAQRQRALTG